MNLYQLACKNFPYQEYTTRKATQVLRAKWIRVVMMMGEKWILHRQHWVKRK